MYIHTYILYEYILLQIYKYIHNIHANQHIQLIIHTIHTYIHAYIHTYIHTGSNATVCPYVVQESYLRNTYIHTESLLPNDDEADEEDYRFALSSLSLMKYVSENILSRSG